MKQMGVYFDQTRCTGCYTCQVACKDWYDIDAGSVNRMKVRIIEEGKFPDPFVAYMASPCYHCENPSCVNVCPQGAITKRELDGVVILDRSACSGREECGALCLKACPWDAPQFGPDENAKMDKCDMCAERLDEGRQVICVEACPMFALNAGPIGDLRDKHGGTDEAAGFQYSKKLNPSVTFKPKK